MNRIVQIAYTFKVSYKAEEHLKAIINELRKFPIADMSGAGQTKEKGFCGYSCRIKGKGVVL